MLCRERRAGLFRRDVPGKVSRSERQLRFRGADIPRTHCKRRCIFGAGENASPAEDKELSESFRVVFFNLTGRNNNQETRLVENGPLLGRVVVSYPTDDPPFTYFVEVYSRIADGEYSRVLKYRGNTGYGDGNPLAVIDSEMPETLRRLDLWKVGDALPVPPRMPGGCTQLVMRKGVEWCEQR